jgi:hypothetical protein
MRNLWKNRNNNATGRLTSKLAAAKSPHACPVEEINEARPTGSVYMSFDVLNVNASKNSFHAARKLNNAVTATAGKDNGRTTLVKT